jgi:hypothetical protein
MELARDRVWAAKGKLKGTKMFMSEDFCKETLKVHQKLLPAMNAARASKSRAHIKGESLIVDGKRYSYNKLDQLPKSINLGTKSNDDIVGFFGKSSEFSNFHPSDFTIDSIPYNCTEQYYQSHKAEEFDDAETASKIMATQDPVQMMRLGKHVNNFNQDAWETEARNVMYKANCAKYSQNLSLRQALLATGDKQLVECSRHDKYWGSGIGLHSKHTLNHTQWTGQNHMGKTLMLVREALRTTQHCAEGGAASYCAFRYHAVRGGSHNY